MRQHFPEESNYSPCIIVQGNQKINQHKSMKKITDLIGNINIPGIEKLFRIMKLTGFFLLISVVSVLAGKTYSQTKLLTLNFEKTSVKEVLSKIEDQSEFYFMYSEKIVDVNREVSVNIENQKIETVLNSLFTGTDVNYTVKDRIIVLTTPDVFDNSAQVDFQQKMVSGKVIDTQNQTLPGVTVVVKGTTQGTVTNTEGEYTLTNIPENATLVFSFMGMRTQEVVVGTQSSINIEMAVDAIGIEEVVAVGYGTVKRADLTGSVGTVSQNDLQEVKVSNIQQALLGKIAGVQVKPNDGTPGAAPQIIIRGVGSLSAGTQPLYVVDGFPVTNLETLNPDDIESVDILKDASSTAIYGSRGSNGVVLITTKRGKLGEAQLNFDISGGLQEVSNTPKYLNAAQMADYAYYGAYFRTQDLGGSTSGDPLAWKFKVPPLVMDIRNGVPGTPDVDWFDEVLRVAPVARYQLSASGGAEKMKYAVSGEYLDQQGIIIGSNFNRYSVRANLDAQLTKKLSVKINLNPSYTEQTGEDPQGTGYGTNILGNAAAINAYTPAFDANGDYFVIDGLPETGNFPNPVALAREITDQTNRIRFMGNIDATYKITDALIFNAMMGANYSASKHLRFVPQMRALLNSTAFGLDEANLGVNWISEYTLNYAKDFGNHHFTGLAGFTSEKSKMEYNSLQSTKFPNNNIPYLNAAGGILTGGGAGISEYSLVSYLARATYDYANRYYLTASIRTDGSSRFGADNRYGVFPSIAAAWRISEENFMQNVSFIDNLKLRFSYGQTGNNNIGNYASLATTANLNYPLNNNPVGGFVQSRISNPILTWEKQSSFNRGFDLAILDSRVSIVVDNFRTDNKSLLLNVNIPAITGFNNALQNIGEIENTGWEFAVNTVNTQGEFSWTTNFNISFYKNKVLKLGPEDTPIISTRHITMVGEPMGAFYGLVMDGIFETEAEYAKGPYYNPSGSNHTRVGDVKFKDFSGPNGTPDGVINSYDRVIIGSPYPDFYYGMTNNFKYKNFSLSIALQGVQGNQIAGLYADVGGRNEFRVKQLAEYADFWISEEQPGNGLAQRPNDEPTGGIREFSTQKLRDGSYLRINNISLGYELPSNLVQRLNLTSIRIYVNANNPITFTDYGGFNPDVSRSGDPLLPGEDNNNYPLAKTWKLGLNIGF